MERTEQKIKKYRDWYFGPQDDPCPGCGARWKKINATEGQLIHTDYCDYDRWVDEEDEKNEATYETVREVK